MAKSRSEYARQARRYVTLYRTAVLSTISITQEGFPFGSLAPYDTGPSGELIIYVSLIAEHYKNLAADSRASLFVMDPFGARDPQAHARATLLVRFERIPDSEKLHVQESYEARFPGSINYEIAHNFVFMRGRPERVRWIGGFGDITWISGDDFRAAEIDPIAHIGHSILDHMNDDHRDALAEIAGEEGRGYDPLMIDIRRDGFTIGLFGGGRRKELEVAFENPISNAEEARREVIAVLRKARGERSR